jgi:hypothetical protein
MQRCRIEIRAVRPNQSLRLSIDSDSAEQLQITQGPKEFARQHWTEIDGLLCLIVELDSQRVVGNDLESGHSADRMRHETLPQRRNRHRSSTLLQPLPIGL